MNPYRNAKWLNENDAGEKETLGYLHVGPVVVYEKLFVGKQDDDGEVIENVYGMEATSRKRLRKDRIATLTFRT